jgi:hypothetical protein
MDRPTPRSTSPAYRSGPYALPPRRSGRSLLWRIVWIVLIVIALVEVVLWLRGGPSSSGTAVSAAGTTGTSRAGRPGTVDYTSVVTAQANALSSHQTALGILQNRVTASVALIAALGGGWDTSQLPQNPEPPLTLP